jgi:hypothetical protein
VIERARNHMADEIARRNQLYTWYVVTNSVNSYCKALMVGQLISVKMLEQLVDEVRQEQKKAAAEPS